MSKSSISIYSSYLLLLLLLIGFSACKAGNKDEIPAISYQPDIERLQLHYSGIQDFSSAAADTLILIDGNDNKLFLVVPDSGKLRILRAYDISASRYGYGAARGSMQTPGGLHAIAGKYGEGQPAGMCFYDRRPTGEIATIYTDTTDVEEDPVTSRILWLEGKEEKNRTSYWRFIYIHGTHEEGLVGTPQSKGCIRMRNADIIELFDMVRKGFYVYIIEPDTINSGEQI